METRYSARPFAPAPDFLIISDGDGTMFQIDVPWMTAVSNELAKLEGGSAIGPDHLRTVHSQLGGGEQGLVDALCQIQKEFGLQSMTPNVFLNAGRVSQLFPFVLDRLGGWAEKVKRAGFGPQIDVSTCGINGVCTGMLEPLARKGVKVTVSGQEFVMPDGVLTLAPSGLRTALTKVDRVNEALAEGVPGCNIFYIGDGHTDKPAGRRVLESGGSVIPVYTPGDDAARRAAEDLWGELVTDARYQGRICAPVPADWSAVGPIDRIVDARLSALLEQGMTADRSRSEPTPMSLPPLGATQQAPNGGSLVRPFSP